MIDDMKWSVLVGAMAACTSRGPVGAIAPGQDDAVVLFADRDGTSRIGNLDDEGKVSGEIEDGGSVWLVTGWNGISSPPSFTAFTDVAIGSTVRFGNTADAPIAVMPVSVALPDGANTFRLTSSCGEHQSNAIAFRLACNGKGDLMVAAYEQVGNDENGPLFYAYRDGIAIDDGQTIAIAASDFKPVEQIDLTITDLDGAQASDLVLTDDTGTWSYQGPTGPTSSLSLAFPLGAPHLELGATLQKGASSQRVLIQIPAEGNQAIPVHAHLAPWVTDDVSATSFSWQIDDENGTLAAQAMVTTANWVSTKDAADDPGIGLSTRVISPPRAPGSVDAPVLPDDLTSRFAAAGYCDYRNCVSSVALIHFPGVASYDDVLELVDGVALGSHIVTDVAISQ